MSECHHEWTPHRIMGGWEQCANCGEQRDGEAPRDAPPAADRLAQTVTDAEVEAACIAANGFAWWDSGAGVGEKETVRVVIRKILEAAIRASESAPAQEGIREAVMRVMRVERDHAIEVFCAADGQSSPKTREEFKAAWDALNELLPLAAAPRAGG